MDINTWASRWRAERGSPPAPPTPDGYDLLAELPDDHLQPAADLVGEPVDDLAWWRAIADRPDRDDVAPMRPSWRVVYTALQSIGPATDADLAKHLAGDIRKIVPRRSELVKAGFVVPVGKEMTESGNTAKTWAVTEPGGREAAIAEAAKKGPRKKHLDDFKPEEQAQIVWYLVNKPECNAILVGTKSTKREAERARREAKAVQREHERRRREHAERVRQAERRAAPELNFLKAVGQLRKGVDAVREVARVLEDDVDNVEFEGVPLIDPSHWPEVRAEVGELAHLAQHLDQLLGRALGDVADDDYIDADVIEDIEFELPPGTTLG